jgi:2-polyprenyl-3-methyl-5-hydroxy-6-metoxy-1,4-benzoquinol methylase
MKCHVCQTPGTVPIEGFEELARVTSDCKPWPPGGRLVACPTCGCVQKVIDEAWRSEAERIYADYTLYYQSDGAEQPVFDFGSGAGQPRSVRLLERILSDPGLAREGRLLDVGCGNGAFLRAFDRLVPGWRLSGTEREDRNRRFLEEISGFDSLYTGPMNSVPGSFELISLIHVLEHIPDPRGILTEVRDKLAPGGLLVIQVPDYSQNPFDLLVADHSTHFNKATLAMLVGSCGFEVVTIASDWVPKEISLIARAGSVPAAPEGAAIGPSLEEAGSAVEWLRNVLEKARALARTGKLGLFGTSIAAMWLVGALGDQVRFFVDEDPQRVGKTLMGRPVYHPEQVPAGSDVLIALAPAVAGSVWRRLSDAKSVYHRPPSLPALSHA